MKIINLTRGTLIADKVSVAENPFTRMKGLLGRRSLDHNEALLIRPCNSIHTFFMSFVIDVIFLDKQHNVVALKEKMPPFKLSRIYLQAYLTLELSASKIAQSQTQLNDLIKFEE